MNRFTDLALDKNAIDFQDLFQEVLSQKVSDALDAKKVEIAATMFEDPAIAEEKIEMTRGGRATGNAIADIIAKNNARLAKKKADRAKKLAKEEVETIDEWRHSENERHSKRIAKGMSPEESHAKMKKTRDNEENARREKRAAAKLAKEEVELEEGMVDHIAKVHVHGSNVTLHLHNGKKSTQKHPSPEAALKDGKAWHKATGREAKLVVT